MPLSIRLSIVCIVALLSQLWPQQANAENVNATIGEIKGRIAQLERAGGYSSEYRQKLEAFIEGINRGYSIAAKRDPDKFHRQGGDPFCEFRKSSYWLEKALASGDESIGMLLSEFVWTSIRSQCGVSGIEPAFERNNRRE